METVWDYFELDGAYFRKRADSGLAAVDEVFWPLPDGWVSYVGERTLPDGRKFTIDSCKPFCFGNKIDESQLPPEARAKRILPPGFREVGKPGDAWIVPGFPKP